MAPLDRVRQAKVGWDPKLQYSVSQSTPKVSCAVPATVSCTCTRKLTRENCTRRLGRLEFLYQLTPLKPLLTWRFVWWKVMLGGRIGKTYFKIWYVIYFLDYNSRFMAPVTQKRSEKMCSALRCSLQYWKSIYLVVIIWATFELNSLHKEIWHLHCQNNSRIDLYPDHTLWHITSNSAKIQRFCRNMSESVRSLNGLKSSPACKHSSYEIFRNFYWIS